MKTAQILITLAVRILPPHRREWGEAMRQEIRAIDGPEATRFAMGCLWVALQERIDPMKMLVTLGRWGVGAVTAAYGLFFLHNLPNAVLVMMGKRPDPFYDMLITNHHTQAAADHLAAYPYMMAFGIGMGVSHLLAAFFLVRWNAKGFAVACTGAALPGLALVVYGVMSGADRIPSYAWPFIPLAMLVTAAIILWAMSRPKTPPALAA